ncbi:MULTISPECIES: hypothetical protein [unclassified Geodermatophilus]
MPTTRRAAACAVVALMAATGCTEVRGDPVPAPRTFEELRAIVDLDAVAPAGVDVLDLAAGPEGAVALLADTADPAVTYLAPVDEDGVGELRRLDGPADQLFVTDDGTAVVTAPGRLTTVPPGGEPAVTDLDVAGDTTALSPDGRSLYLATQSRLAAVDPATGDVRATADVDAGLTVRALAVSPGGGPTALLSDARAVDLADVAVLGTWSADLAPGDLVELAPDRPASIPNALRIADDGTAVVTLTAGSGEDPFRVVTVSDGEVTASHRIPGTDSPLADLAVSPDARVAYLPVAGFEVESGVVTLDLASGEQLGAVRVCEGQASFGRVALSGDRLTVIGSCITAAPSSSTAFVVA